MIQKIAVIGDRISALGFRALGMDIFSPKDSESTRRTLIELTTGDYGIILITEDYAAPICDTIEKYRKKMSPIIVLIPDRFGSKGSGIEAINLDVEKAIGKNLL